MHIAMQTERALRRQVIEQRCGLVKEQWQKIFHPGTGDAVGDILVHRTARGVAFEGIAKAFAKTIAAGFVHRKFACRQQADFSCGIDRALGVDIEGLDGVDDIVHQVDAIGQGTAHGKQIDQSAAHAELARRHDLGDMGVAGQRELRAQRLDVQSAALLEEKSMRGQIRGGRQAIQRGRGRHDHDIEFLALHAIERGQSLGHQIGMRREVVVGQGFPVRQQRQLEAWVEPGHLGQQALRIRGQGANDGQRLVLRRQPRQRQRIAMTKQILGTAGRTGLCRAGIRIQMLLKNIN